MAWAILASAAGCAHLNNPWKDAGAACRAEMTTTSAEGFWGRSEFGRQLRRNWPEACVRYENGVVTHWPLWFEDPFEDKGNRCALYRFRSISDRGAEEADLADAPDNTFAWNGVDYFHIAYGPGRLVLNAVGWPIGAFVTPPGMLMESDGRINQGLIWHDHDAGRADASTREPPDVAAIERPPASLGHAHK